MAKKQRKGGRMALLLVLMLLGVGFLTILPQLNPWFAAQRVEYLGLVEIPEWIEAQTIPVDGTSRRGEKLEDIQNIVIHYVANPGTSAQQNRKWYMNPESEVSSHFLVGLSGEILQCIPLDEKSSATNHRNRDTISIEVCHPDETGKFTGDSYASLVELTAWLLDVCKLDPKDVIRHYDVTGKMCPLYFVEHEDSWNTFLSDVGNSLQEVRK